MELEQAIFFLLGVSVFIIFLIICIDFLLSIGKK
jgi:nitrogen fixation-related uncharacterized protein